MIFKVLAAEMLRQKMSRLQDFERYVFSLSFYLTIRLRARVFYEQIVNEAQPSWLSLVENEGE